MGAHIGPKIIASTGEAFRKQLVDHPDRSDLWRHNSPMWEPCYVCGGPTCWVEMDIGFKHPECDMYPSEEGHVRIVLGVEATEEEK